MTPEEKAKAYDEALSLMVDCVPDKDGLVHVRPEDIFPELQESEDERIRKWIIDDIIYNMDNEPLNNSEYKKEAEKAIAWLEKQGQEKHLSEPIKDYQGSFTCWNNAHDFRPKHLQRCICYDKYMGGVYCYVYDDISKYWCTQTTEEHDSDGDNHISDYADYRITLWMPLPDTSFYPSKSLLEKQGEQKSMWTEEDSLMIDSIIDTIKWLEGKGATDMKIDWLKSLKQRIHDNSAKTCENDTLLDLLNKMPSCITVDGIDYHFVMKKTVAYMAFYEGEGEGSGKVIFWMAGDPVDLLTAMLEKLKEEGLLE